MLIFSDLCIQTSSYSFDLKFNKRKTLLAGESSTGKTFLCRMILDYKKMSGSTKNYKDIYVFKYDAYDIAPIIKTLTKKFIIIDNADIFFEEYPDLVRLINEDRINQYLIIGRAVSDIEITPNSYAILNFCDKNRTFSFEYPFYEKGWN